MKAERGTRRSPTPGKKRSATSRDDSSKSCPSYCSWTIEGKLEFDVDGWLEGRELTSSILPQLLECAFAIVGDSGPCVYLKGWSSTNALLKDLLARLPAEEVASEVFDYRGYRLKPQVKSMNRSLFFLDFERELEHRERPREALVELLAHYFNHPGTEPDVATIPLRFRAGNEKQAHEFLKQTNLLEYTADQIYRTIVASEKLGIHRPIARIYIEMEKKTELSREEKNRQLSQMEASKPQTKEEAEKHADFYRNFLGEAD